ncbi:MAG TPA: PIG-L family deacetylase [Roseiflexaceae bacterium]|nr:PIG-L family deacetylase [Roseiflexaceae bacterium]
MRARSYAFGPPRFLGVFAHPDDETFCAGGTLAKYTAAGAEAMVVSATRGDAGQIRDARVATRRTLGQVRERELMLACERLGVQQVRCLDYGDGTLKDIAQETLIRDVTEIIRMFHPDVVITFGEDGAYGHPDHIAISTSTTAACTRAGDATQFPEQIATGLAAHKPTFLYYSHFPRSRMLLLERLVQWLVSSDQRFRGTPEFIRALLLLCEETSMLGYTSDHVAVEWYPPGFYVVEQGEPSAKLYLIMSGEAQAIQEDASGTLHPLGRLGPGMFFGELGIANRGPRSAHVVAQESMTCLVFSPGQPTLFAGRGTSADERLARVAGGLDEFLPTGATNCIDVNAYVERKIAAVAAHRSQYPIEPDMLPLPMLQEMIGREYFVRVLPKRELDSDLLG